MKRYRLAPPSIFFICLGLIFISAAIFRMMETDQGKIVIQPVVIDSKNEQPFYAVEYRPLQAQALNPRPAVLLIPGFHETKEDYFPLAQELARRDFVVVAVDNFGQGKTMARSRRKTSLPDSPPLIDAGFTYLSTRNYIHSDQLGIAIGFPNFSGSLANSTMTLFNATVLITPDRQTLHAITSRKPLQNLLIINPNGTEADIAEIRKFPLENGETPAQVIEVSAFPPRSARDASLIHPTLDWFQNRLKVENERPGRLASRDSRLFQREGWLCALFLLLILAFIPFGMTLKQLFPWHEPSGSAYAISNRMVVGLSVLLIFCGAAVSLWAFRAAFAYPLSRAKEALYSPFAQGAFLYFGVMGIVQSILGLIIHIQGKAPMTSRGFFQTLAHFASAALIASSGFLFLYALTFFFSRGFQINPGARALMLRPLESFRYSIFLKTALAICLYFISLSSLFADSAKAKSAIRMVPCVIGGCLSVGMLTHSSSCENWMNGLLSKDWTAFGGVALQQLNLFDSFAEFGRFLSGMGFDLTLQLLFFVGLQSLCIRFFRDKITGGIFSGLIFAWMITASGALL